MPPVVAAYAPPLAQAALEWKGFWAGIDAFLTRKDSNYELARMGELPVMRPRQTTSVAVL